MRKRPGIGAIQKQRVEQGRFRDKGTELQDNLFEQMTGQMEGFRAKLEDFASKHRNEIRKDPAFRKQFQDMCASIGVDPLASSKGFWSQVLGVGDFYYELSVQVVEVCLATSHRNGGLITLNELRQRLINARGKAKHHQEISNDDILRAISKLKVLGSGFTTISLDGNKNTGQLLIRSIPGELSADHASVLRVAENESYTTISALRIALKWEDFRCRQVLNELVRDGVAWLDEQGTETSYWFPSLSQLLLKEE
nr:EOG090X09XM [Sida crystallina]